MKSSGRNQAADRELRQTVSGAYKTTK